MGECQIFAFDLDGTMLQKGGFLSPRAESALRRAAAQGIELVPATGRILNFLPASLTQLPFIHYAITSNGAAVYDLRSRERLGACLLPCKRAWEILCILREYPVFVEIYAEGRPVVRERDLAKAFTEYGFPERKRMYLQKDYRLVDSLRQYITAENIFPEKINLPYVPDLLREELRQRLSRESGLKLVSSAFDNLEVNAVGCHKGVGLAALCYALGVAPEHTAAIGDNGNDLEMLEFAGLSIAMGNATEEVKKIASTVTASCEEDGAALAIERYLLHDFSGSDVP